MRGIIRLLIVAALLAAIPLVTRSGVADPPSLPRNLGSRLRAHIDTLAKAGGTGSRVVFTDGNRWAVEYVLAEMRKSTPNVRADTFMVARKSRKTPSSLVDPVAIIAGKSDSIIVICAHIDASGSRDGGWDGNWSRAHAPGADDDGTGIAALLETLTLVAHSDLKPQYTLMFVACNAEERNPDYAGLARADGHHLGSRYMAGKLSRDRKPVRAVISMDMVGWNPGEDYMPIFTTPRSRWLAADLQARRSFLGLDLNLATIAAPCPNSDNESFDRFGFPAVLLMESCKPWVNDRHHPRNPVYHTSRDLPTMVSYGLLEKVTRLISSYALKQ
ncbi:MAG: Peptidase family [Chlorobi bacterium]|nr:Peptidase family [Chlorobiota bacterium]